MARIKVEGLAELIDQVKEFEDDALTKQVYKAAADVVYDQADLDVPEQSGALRGTGRTSGTKSAGVIRYGKAAVPYAGPAHFGHYNRPQGGYMDPVPWLYDAAESTEDQVVEVVEVHVGELVARF